MARPTIRITGGTHNGTELVTRTPARVSPHSYQPLRPLMSKVREALFSLLPPVTEFTMLDLFSGTGIVAFEALSRGAAAATLVESNSSSCALLRLNMKLFPNPIRLHNMPVEAYIDRYAKPHDLIFIDPPYRYGYKIDLLKRIAHASIVTRHLIIHHFRTEPFPAHIDAPIPLTRYDQRKYGGSVLELYHPAPS